MANRQHDYHTCRDGDCLRLACVAYREGYRDGFEDGQEAASDR